MLKTYVITVAGSDRTRWIIERLASLSDFLDVDVLRQEPGNELDLVALAVKGLIKLFPMHSISDKIFDKCQLEYKRGTLGCMLGHYQANERLLADDHDFALIVEDNIEFDSGFREAVTSALAVLDGTPFDIVHLFSSLEKPRKNFAANVFHGDGEWGTTKAQIVSRAFAKFVRSNIPFHEVSDGVTMIPSLDWVPTGLKSFVVQPFPVRMARELPSTRTGIDTAIPKGHVVYKRVPKTVASFFAGFMNKEGHSVYEYDGMAYMVSFGLGKARVTGDRFVFVDLLTSNEILQYHSIIPLDTITPDSFREIKETIAIEFDKEFCIFTKKDLTRSVGDNSIVFPYLRETIVPRLQDSSLHRLVSPVYYYEKLYTPFYPPF